MDSSVPTLRNRRSNRKGGQVNAAAGAPLGIIVDLLPPGFPTRPGTHIRPTTLTIHNTDNASPGADAAAHNRYIRGADAIARKVSWHFTVDDRTIYQHLPIYEKGWHAGPANATSVGIEICMHRGMNEAAAYDRAAKLCVFLGTQLGIAMPQGLRQHHDWTGKNCPRVLRSRPDGWQGFLDRVAALRRGARASTVPDVTFLSASTASAEAYEAAAGGEDALTEIDRHFAEHAEDTPAQALPIPAGDPIAFAVSTAAETYWPVVTRHPRAMEVNSRLADGGTSGGNASRRFMADRNGGARYHCAIDLYCSQGDAVVAVEDGRIVNFYPFYQGTNALLVQHAGHVVNYGEVAPNSLTALGLRIGDRVRAGQRIGTIGRLNMLHFETYASGTTRNYSWPQSSPRPSRLRNPSQLLLNLAVSAERLDTDQSVSRVSVIAPESVKTLSAPAIAFAPAAIPAMDQKDWHSFGNGMREWRYDERGLDTREHGVITKQRWEQSLDTMRKIMEYMGVELLAASAKHGIPPALLMMTVATETHIYKAQKFTGPETFRWEAHVQNDDVNPPTLGDYSAGPMQSLGTTARWIIRAKGAEYGLHYMPFEIAPVYPAKPDPRPADHPLYSYAANLDLGAAEIRIRLGKSGLDPIFVAAAFNAGGLYKSPHSPWGLRTYGDHLDRAAKWYGDACDYLIEIGVH
ncbi:peptidoglycan DD-metalloendopeptidase family protein [Mesorhizobium intechi]|uniref:N-acetylmuramoyl-L-alanine amidase n=1 Tax=Mesorhizobium intechi TaxID=537601 RepID=A0A8T9AWS8_9HYPH|nr:N-acetylmuramoyl-L-alanine amidase [Mesorhizobium intechi]TSE13544.1 peptidoglycan DD-metalloendopeptidase family protein [Mesorhizobium intechi]